MIQGNIKWQLQKKVSIKQDIMWLSLLFIMSRVFWDVFFDVVIQCRYHHDTAPKKSAYALVDTKIVNMA